LFVKHFSPIIGKNYPDNGCTFETYTNDVMLELETLSPLATIAPGGVALHKEEWAFYKESAAPSNDEKEIAALMAKYMK